MKYQLTQEVKYATLLLSRQVGKTYLRQRWIEAMFQPTVEEIEFPDLSDVLHAYNDADDEGALESGSGICDVIDQIIFDRIWDEMFDDRIDDSNLFNPSNI
jgi:hypothetical protein